MRMTTTTVTWLLAVPLLAAPARASGLPLNLDPGTPFGLYSVGSNDGYIDGRGMVFTADEDLIVNGAALWTTDTAGLNATFELYETQTTVGNVLAGAVLLASVQTTLQGALGFHGDKFIATNLTAGNSYLLRVSYIESAAENWFYDFDPVFYGDLPVDIGPITLIDGTHVGGTDNFVAPYLQLQIVPAPGVLALFALAGLCGTGRRRR